LEATVTDLLPAAHGRAAPDLSALGGALASILEQGRAVNIVYAPTTVHHHAASAPVPVAPSVLVLPAAAGGGNGAGHAGIDVDLTGFGGEYAAPVFVAALPEVPEGRSWAPLVLLVSGWSGIGAVFATAVTGGSAVAIACVALALVVSGAAFSVVYRNNR
jgi:hypothetical protein